MSKYKFNLIERQSLYEAYEKRCFYCGEIVFFRELQIDHIVPENLLFQKSKYENFLLDSGISDSFEINSFQNWVPCHSRCNNRKSGEIFDLKTTLYFLGLAQRKIGKIKKIETSIISKLDSDILLTTITFALSENKIDSSEIKNLVVQYDKRDKVNFKLFSELEFVDRVYRNWISQDDFTELLMLPVKTGSPDNEGVYLTDPNDSKIIVNIKNCKEYFHYKNKGYHAHTTYSLKMSAFFERTFGLIKVLKEASIPTYNFISDSNLTINNFELMPLSLFKSFAPDTTEIVDSLPETTFQNWIDNGNFKVIDQFKNGFHIVHDGEGLVMIELLRADLNSDNNEDVLVYCYSYAIEGTFGYGYTNIISRLDNESKFIEIKSVSNNV